MPISLLLGDLHCLVMRLDLPIRSVKPRRVLLGLAPSLLHLLKRLLMQLFPLARLILRFSELLLRLPVLFFHCVQLFVELLELSLVPGA